jgi:predicted nucleotidyltransferase
MISDDGSENRDSPEDCGANEFREGAGLLPRQYRPPALPGTSRHHPENVRHRRRTRPALAPVQGIDVVLIFGSVAAGTATAKNDVDLLVIGSVGLRKLIPALRGLADSLGREINPICLTPAEWLQNRAKGDAFTTCVSSEPKLWLKGGPDALAAMEG